MHQKKPVCVVGMCGEVQFLFYETCLGGGRGVAQRMNSCIRVTQVVTESMLLYCVKMPSHLICLAFYFVPFQAFAIHLEPSTHTGLYFLL